MICLRCGKNETEKKIDGKPICTPCMMKDAKDNHGRVIDYSGLKAVAPKMEKRNDLGCPAKKKTALTGKPLTEKVTPGA